MHLKELCVEEKMFDGAIAKHKWTEASAIQTPKLVTSIKDDKRHDILEKAGISPAVITPENMITIKVDLGIPWQKLKCMAR